LINILDRNYAQDKIPLKPSDEECDVESELSLAAIDFFEKMYSDSTFKMKCKLEISQLIRLVKSCAQQLFKQCCKLLAKEVVFEADSEERVAQSKLALILLTSEIFEVTVIIFP